jgi:hypothetical protein
VQARPVVSAEPGVVLLQGGPAAWDVAVVGPPQAVPDAAQGLRQEEAAWQVAAAVQWPEAALAGEGPQREVPGAPARELPSAVASAIVWAAAWASHRDQALPWPAP